jgi:integrase
MGASVRQQNGSWYIFIRHRGERAAHKCVDQQHAEDTRKAVLTAIAAGQFDLTSLRKKREANRPAAEKPAVATLGEYYKRFEKVYLAASCRKGTRDRYATSFKHILPELGPLPLNEITRERIKDFVAHLVSKRYERRLKVKTYPDPAKKRNPIIEWKKVEVPLSKTSIRIILSELCAVLSHAVEEGVIDKNPALKLGKFYKQAKNGREEIQPFAAEEVEAFLAAVLDRSWSRDYYPVFLCALHTGMRAGEIVGLQWGDADFKGKFFILRRQFTRGRIEPTKTGKTHRVDMSDALAAELQALKKRRQAEFLAKGSNEVPKWIFCNKEGNPLDYYNLKRRHFEKCLEHAGLRRIRFHDLRHTYATLLLMQGESPVYVKEQLGHSSIKVTVDIYGHWIPGANRAAVNRLPTLKSTSMQKTEVQYATAQILR